MEIRKQTRENVQPHTSALNDILFILLLFFLIISTLANPNVIKVSNPSAKSDAKAKQTIVVTVDSLKHFYVGTTLTPSDSLTAVLSRVARKTDDAEPTVVINGDKNANWGEITLVMQAAKAAKMKVVASVENSNR